MVLRSLALALTAGLVFPGCTGCSRTASADAGTTADAGHDAQVDAGAQTGTCDSSVTSDWPGYRRLTNLSPCCVVDVALDARASLPALDWIPCSNGVAGCQEVKQTWVPGNGSVFQLGTPVSRDSTGAPALLPLVFPLVGSQWMMGFYALPSQTVVAGFHADTGPGNAGPQNCLFDTLATGTNIALLARAGLGGPMMAAQGPPANAGALSFQMLAPAGAIPGYQYSGASATRLAFDVPGPVEQWAFDSGALVGSQNATGAALNFDFVEGDDVYAYSGHGTTGWYSEYRVAGDGTVTLFRGVTGRQIYAMASDGSTFAWCEAYGTSSPAWQQPTVELWTAPYTNNPAQLATTAKKLVTLPGAVWCGGGSAFQGYYVTHTTSGFDVATVVRLADGALQQVRAGPSRSFGVIAFATQTEIWSVLDRVLDDAGSRFSGYAFARYQLGMWP